jgi:ADP-ribose pyrophosphatase YjhB (NUDIX family)
MSRAYSFARPLTTVDVLLFTVRDFWARTGELPRLEVALIERDREPFEGRLALPGTVMRIEPDEQTGEIDGTDLHAARRVLRTKLGVKAPHLEQLFTWFTRTADPRGPTTVIAYFAVVPFDHFKDASGQAIVFTAVDQLPELAFNHNEIIAKGVERVRGKALYSTLPALLLPRYFTIKEMQSIYEAVTDRTFDVSNFQKRMLDMGIVKEVDPESRQAIEARERAVKGQTGRRPKVFKLAVGDRLTTFAKTAF